MKNVSPARIARTVARVQRIPADEYGTIPTPLPYSARRRPNQPSEQAWDNAKVKKVRLSKMVDTHARMTKRNLIWHVQHPGVSRYGQDHPRVMKRPDGSRVVMDGHHRLAALLLLGVKKHKVRQLKDGQ